MVDPDEDVYRACKREFLEEVFDIDEASPEEKVKLKSAIDELFGNPIDIYKGYVDDPRNTGDILGFQILQCAWWWKTLRR